MVATYRSGNLAMHVQGGHLINVVDAAVRSLKWMRVQHEPLWLRREKSRGSLGVAIM